MPHITTSRIRTYYEAAGAGPRLLYISGTGGDLRAKPSIFDHQFGGTAVGGRVPPSASKGSIYGKHAARKRAVGNRPGGQAAPPGV